jgi:hypothetical protein
MAAGQLVADGTPAQLTRGESLEDAYLRLVTEGEDDPARAQR